METCSWHLKNLCLTSSEFADLEHHVTEVAEYTDAHFIKDTNTMSFLQPTSNISSELSHQVASWQRLSIHPQSLRKLISDRLMLQVSIRITTKERSLLAHDLIQEFDRYRLHPKEFYLPSFLVRFRSDITQTIQSTLFISKASALVTFNQQVKTTWGILSMQMPNITPNLLQ